MPDNVIQIISTLEKAGFEAYAVGGCVRDAIMGRVAHDWDITTSANPNQVKELFRRTIDTGIQHGTVTVMIDKEGYEVTTYRLDGVYEDARHPKEVTFTSNLIEDLKRRDFTINAMAYNNSRGLVDEFDGIGDLEKKIIRCVGNPEERFSEDALRMMRAVRFAAQLDFKIEDSTAVAIRKMAPNIEKVSAERIMQEFTKLITSNHPEKIREAYNYGLTHVFLPEFDICMETTQNNPHHCYDVGEHIIHTMMSCDSDRILRFTMLLHDIAKPQTRTVDANGTTHNKGHAEAGAQVSKTILKRLKSDNALIDAVTVLVRYHDWRFGETKAGMRKALNKIGVSLFPLLLAVQRADIAGQSDYDRDVKYERVNRAEKLYLEILADNEAFTMKDLSVSGQDIMSAGIPAGPQVGEILNSMLEHILEYPEDNKKEILLKKFIK